MKRETGGELSTVETAGNLYLTKRKLRKERSGERIYNRMKMKQPFSFPPFQLGRNEREKQVEN
ncbi:MAG: hypothetical protein DRI23_12310 [Candidatus Cloacimonadota bacterium]|nr:MAG: hypothetical protein DRI23_12310 [Candidatus Cloacimonadota bacterium]